MQNFLKAFKPKNISLLLKSNKYFLNQIKFRQPPLHMNSICRNLTTSYHYKFASSKQNYKNMLKSTYEGDGFYMEQLFTGCLAIYSYYIESGNECLIIDPLNDIARYTELIQQRKKRVKGIFISHYHADYVSGQHELQKKYGCKIYMGPSAVPNESTIVLKDYEELSMGNIKLQCIHTPGHTEESSCLLIFDQSKKSSVIFTGDTLFLNQVGRPDLAVKTTLTAQDLAAMLFHSIQKLKKLHSDIRIYPGHGSGSACGKSIGKGDFCSVGTQKTNNYALKIDEQSKFIQAILDEMPSPPQYFGYNASINKFLPFSYEDAAKKVHNQLSPEKVNELVKKDKAVIIDVRTAKELTSGIIEGSLCFGFEGPFATWVGTVISPDTKIILYGSQNEAKQSIARLLRIGYINILGHANFTIKDWKLQQLPSYTPQFVQSVLQQGTTVLDVRKPSEWKNDGIVQGEVLKCELTHLFKHPETLDKNKKYIIHCRSGYRAKIAYSFLKSQGFQNVKVYPKSFDSIFESGQIKKAQ